MARARRSQPRGQQAELKCPECGRTFTRAAALGSHRRQAHGVAGASAQAKPRATRRGSSSKTRSGASRGSSTSRRAASRRPAASAAGRSRAAAATGGATKRRAGARTSNRRINRDALLQTLFPNGLPAREQVIRSVNTWLDEAERLARLK